MHTPNQEIFSDEKSNYHHTNYHHTIEDILHKVRGDTLGRGDESTNELLELEAKFNISQFWKDLICTAHEMFHAIQDDSITDTLQKMHTLETRITQKNQEIIDAYAQTELASAPQIWQEYKLEIPDTLAIIFEKIFDDNQIQDMLDYLQDASIGELSMGDEKMLLRFTNILDPEDWEEDEDNTESWETWPYAIDDEDDEEWQYEPIYEDKDTDEDDYWYRVDDYWQPNRLSPLTRMKKALLFWKR